MATSIQSRSHRRITKFVEWIRTPEEKEEVIRAQAEEVRARLRAQAENDGLVVRSTPNSGSFAKRTGLRRHMHGNAEIEGQDVDLPFVVSPKDRDGERIQELINRFARYAKASYPETKQSPTKSSVRLSFAATKLNFDVVPMLAVSGRDEEQVLLRADGERRRTSLQKHVEFVRSRTTRSMEQNGRVRFNEVVRIFKWWREMRQANGQALTDVPTIVIELLCAKAFDELGVDETYTATMARWFGRIASAVKRKEAIGFTDFVANPFTHAEKARWAVIDPVNPENIVVPASWGNLELSELADWFATGRDEWARLTADEIAGNDARSMQGLVTVFGTPFKSHGEIA